MEGLTLLDYGALAWFAACWVGFTLYADYSRWREKSVTAVVESHRIQWMRNMVGREMRMIDAIIQANLLSGVGFFASTSLLLVGGLLTILGATDRAVAILGDLPFTVDVSRSAWELKVLLLVVIFIYAFFKFAWAHRLIIYCSILVGAAPLDTNVDDAAEQFARKAAGLHTLAGRHFNTGVRSYFFALAGLAWFLHPLVFMTVTAWVTYVLYRREFRSKSYQILAQPSP